MGAWGKVAGGDMEVVEVFQNIYRIFLNNFGWFWA